MTFAAAYVALAEGRWSDARASFEIGLGEDDSGEARFGLATALWWLGESQACVDQASGAYALLRRTGDDDSAARCAIWLAITYKANFANIPAAKGWIARAARLLAQREPDELHGWLWIARGYQNPDLDAAEALTARAVELARDSGDVDLELVALSQLGVIRVGKGDGETGFALIDEAMAAALAGERTTLDTVVYTCCDMLNACEIASDLDRAAQWCRVADDFVETYGCPFLYGECRIYYGSVLAAKGRWDEAARELDAGLRITDSTCPALHARGRIRLAHLRIRQGRLEEAQQLLAVDVFPDPAKALAEMARVVSAGGAVAVAVPAALDIQPAFAPFVALAGRHAGPDAMSLLSAYFACGDLDDLAQLVASPGLEVVSAAAHDGTYRAPSVDAFVTTEVESTPLVDRLTDEVYARIRAGAHDVLAPFTTTTGAVEAPFTTNIVTARRAP